MSSPTAPDDFRVTDSGFNTEIRIGDPSVTIDGRHRYRIEYILDRCRRGRQLLELERRRPD